MTRLLRLLEVSRKELVQLRRDRITMALIIGIPVVQILLFGYAIETDVRHLRTAVADASGSRESRDLVERFVNTTYFDVVARTSDADTAEAMLRREQVDVVLVLPYDYARRTHRGEPATIGLLIDAADRLKAATALDVATSLALDEGLRLARADGVATTPRLELRSRAWYNPDLSSALYVVPGLVAVILTLTLVLMTVLSITREQERGTMEMLITTPIGKLELLLGKLLPYFAIGYVVLTLVLAIAHFGFAVPMHGSVLALYAFSAVFILANLAVGLLFSTLARNQLQAMQLGFFFFLPTILLSGFMFPLEAMPPVIHWISRLLPATHYLRIVRGTLLKGFEPAQLAPHLWPQAAFLVVVLGLALARFRKRLG